MANKLEILADQIDGALRKYSFVMHMSQQTLSMATTHLANSCSPVYKWGEKCQQTQEWLLQALQLLQLISR